MPTPGPAFVSLPGDIVGSPPYLARDCLMQAMFLEGDREAQQAFCDLALNAPSGGRLAFRAITGKVLLTAIYSQTLGSEDPPDRDKGVVQEWDVGFWTAVHGGRRGEEDSWSTYWLPSYLFVDTAAAMASGREIYGYPKTTAGFSGRSADAADPTVTLDVLHFPVFGPAERPVTGPLVRISRGAPAGGHAPTLEDSLEAAWELFHDFTHPGPAAFEGRILPPLPHLSMPQIMLRQSRDPVDIGRADLQSVISVAPEPTALKGAGLLHSPVRVDIEASASHPIMQTLGLQTSQGAALGVFIKMDFRVGAASRLD